MMLPKPPTDNLYKFLAISGLALACFCVFLNLHRVETYISQFSAPAAELLEFDSRVADLEESGVVLDTNVRKYSSPCYAMGTLKQKEQLKFEEDSVSLERYFRDAETLQGAWAQETYFKNGVVRGHWKESKHFTDAQYDAWARSMTADEYQKLMASYCSLAKSLKHDLFKHIATVEAAWDSAYMIEEYSRWCDRGIYAGWMLGVLGFSLWYLKLQRHQDKLLLKQIEENKEATTPPLSEIS